MLKKISFIILPFLLLAFSAKSQQFPQFSQRMIDVLWYNPAFAGTKSSSEAIYHSRSQWKNFEGAPSTKAFSLHGKINRIMGLGGFIMSDQAGPSKNLAINLSYAHHIDFNALKWTLGIGGNFTRFGIDGREITLYEENDEAVDLEVNNKSWNYDITFGTYLYNQHFYFGFSVLQLLGKKVEIFNSDGKLGIIPLTRHFYISGGMTFNAFTVDIEPSLLITKTPGAPITLDMNLQARFLDYFMTGFSFRMKDAFILVGGVQFLNKYKITYSFDIVSSPLKTYNSGSHEIILSAKLPSGKKYNRYKHEYQYDFNPKTKKWRERW